MGLGTTIRRWQAERAARARLSALDLGARLKVTGSLRLGGRTEVLRARLGERKVIAKLGQSPGAAERLGAEAQILTEKGQRLGRGPDRVPEVLHLDADAGVLIVEEIEAESLAALLARATVERRALLDRAAAWCAAYTRGERVSDDFGGGFWLRQRGTEVAGFPAGPLRETGEALVGLMRSERARIANRPVTRARSHGNLTPDNLLAGPEAVWGVGVEAGHWIALVKDIARFLVDLDARMPGEGGGPAGLDAGDVAAFAEAGLVYPGELDVVLPFFAASELVGRLARAADGGDRKSYLALGERMMAAHAPVN